MHSTTIVHAAVAEQIMAQGYAVIRPPDDGLLGAVDQEIDRLLRSTARPLAPTPFSGFRTIRYFDLLNEGEVWQKVAVQNDVLRIVKHILGSQHLLSLMCTALIQPEEKAQPIHADDDIYELPRPHRPLVVNTLWALCDFTAENGATRVIPGSHGRADAPRGDEHAETVPIEMPRGSIALILGTTYHGAGANRSSARRDALIVNYCAGYMRQHENLFLNLSAERVGTFSKVLRALLGCPPTSTGLGILSDRTQAALARGRRAP